jgi:CBS domain-containing protein
MLRDVPVRQLMASDVLSFTPEENVRDAMRALLRAGYDAGPVVDGDGRVVGMLSTGDLIVQESSLHLPAVISILGATIVLPGTQERFERDLEKSLGATVGEVMADDPVTCDADATVEDAATLMHDNDVSRLPVVGEEGRLVGLLARGDIVRAIVADLDAADGTGAEA